MLVWFGFSSPDCSFLLEIFSLKNSVVQDSAKTVVYHPVSHCKHNVAHTVWLQDRCLNKNVFVSYGFEPHWNLPTDLRQFQALQSRGRPSSILLQTFAMLQAEPKLGLEEQYFIAISQNTNFLYFQSTYIWKVSLNFCLYWHTELPVQWSYVWGRRAAGPGCCSDSSLSIHTGGTGPEHTKQWGTHSFGYCHFDKQHPHCQDPSTCWGKGKPTL